MSYEKFKYNSMGLLADEIENHKNEPIALKFIQFYMFIFSKHLHSL